MVLTATQCAQQIRHTLGGELSSELDPLRITNEVGRMFVTMHPWKWLETAEANLNLRGSISITGGSWDLTGNAEGELHFTKASAFDDYTFSDGDTLEVTAGTGAVLGHYRVTKRVADGDAILLESDISAAGGDLGAVISATLHTDAIILPSDFRDLIAYSTTSGLLTGLTLTSYQDLIDRRQSTSTYSAGYYYGAIAHPMTVGKESSVGSPTPRLEIYPEPTTDQLGAIRIFYHANWPELTSDTDLLVIPEYTETLFLQLLRAFARGYEEEDQASLSVRLNEISIGPLFIMAVQRDGDVQPDYGPLRGGLVNGARKSRHGFSLNFNTIAD